MKDRMHHVQKQLCYNLCWNLHDGDKIHWRSFKGAVVSMQNSPYFCVRQEHTSGRAKGLERGRKGRMRLAGDA